MADKRINATEGREEIAGKRYTELREIIKNNSSLNFKDIIQEIAGISPGGYYNYTSKNSDRYGKVSLHTVKHLSSYFKLPQGIFDCSLDLDDETKEKIAKTIKNNFSDQNNKLIQEIKDLSAKLIKQDDLETLEKSSIILMNTINILKNKIEILKL